MDAVFTPDELAERYHMTPEALRMWRYRGKGPRHFKAGKRVLYREAAVLEWEREQEAAQVAKAS